VIPVPLPVPTGYRIERVLASGGIGITYESELKLGTRVAIKEYYPADLRSLQGCSAI